MIEGGPRSDDLIRLALEEDLDGLGDVTSLWTVPQEARAAALVVARGDLVVSGLPLAQAVLAAVDAAASFVPLVAEGTEVGRGEVLAELAGRARSLLTAERTLLNLLARVCAVATQARRFAREVEGTGARVVDTRKTTPGLRFWEKRAVVHGGCANHRFGLFDMVLIKDNHVVAAGGVGAAVRLARASAPFTMKVEVEVEDEAGLREALAAGADIVMLDNIAPAEMRRLVPLARGLRPHALLEASGRIQLGTVRTVAETGVDLISSSALTAGAPMVDIAMDFIEPTEGSDPSTLGADATSKAAPGEEG